MIRGLLLAALLLTAGGPRIAIEAPEQATAGSLLFPGGSVGDVDGDRFVYSRDGTTANLGASAFTFEYWLKCSPGDNVTARITPGTNTEWTLSNIVHDANNTFQNGGWGTGISGDAFPNFGLRAANGSERTIEANVDVCTDAWVHIANQLDPSTGAMSIYVAGTLGASATGPASSVAWDGTSAMTGCGPSMNLDCTYADEVGATGVEKADLDHSQYPGCVNCLIAEMRGSNVIRYTENFTPETEPFESDANTMFLFHFGEGSGTTVNDSSGENNDGALRIGDNMGPTWNADSPF